MTGNDELKKAIDYIDEAIAVTRLREASCPAFPLYASTLIQLNSIRNILLGTEEDKSRLHKLTIGVWAVKEFEDTDPELADVLFTAYSIGDQIARGLKIQLPDGQPLESLLRPAPPLQE